MTWMPKKRNVTYQERPEWVPEWVYTEAQSAKRFYNEEWEFWVWETSKKDNVSQVVAEDACIRGLKTALDRVQYVWGPKVAAWYIQYLDMGDIFSKVKHPEYKKVKLDIGATNG